MSDKEKAIDKLEWLAEDEGLKGAEEANFRRSLQKLSIAELEMLSRLIDAYGTRVGKDAILDTVEAATPKRVRAFMTELITAARNVVDKAGPRDSTPHAGKLMDAMYRLAKALKPLEEKPAEKDSAALKLAKLETYLRGLKQEKDSDDPLWSSVIQNLEEVLK